MSLLSLSGTSLRLNMARICQRNALTHMRTNYTLSHPPPSSQNDRDDSDDLPIPKTGSWSVHTFLDSLPRPVLDAATIYKLHRLTALHPPPEGSDAWNKTKSELEEMIRLVEGVRQVDFGKEGEAMNDGSALVDARVIEEDALTVMEEIPEEVDPDEVKGTGLLEFAKKTKDGLYIVESDRRRS